MSGLDFASRRRALAMMGVDQYRLRGSVSRASSALTIFSNEMQACARGPYAGLLKHVALAAGASAETVRFNPVETPPGPARILIFGDAAPGREGMRLPPLSAICKGAKAKRALWRTLVASLENAH